MTIIGDGPCRHELQKLASDLGVEPRVTWRGFQGLDATLAAMAQSGILVHPARVADDGNADGTPQTILWAQAMGLPVVTTATGSIPDIVTHTDSGVLVEANDPNALADAVLGLVDADDFQEHLEHVVAPRVRARHSLDAVTSRLRATYEQAVMTFRADR